MRFAWLLLLLATPAFAGPPDVSLANDGALVLDGKSFPVDYDEPDGPHQTTLAMVKLPGERFGVYLVTHLEQGEDPPPRHQVFLVDGTTLVKVHDHAGAPITFARGAGSYFE